MVSDNTFIDSKQVEALPFPAVIINSSGVLVFKNKAAYKLKLVPKSRNFKSIVQDDHYQEYRNALDEKKSIIIKCKRQSGISHAAIVPCDNDEFIVCLAICAMAIESLMKFGQFELVQETFKINDRLLKSYAQLCEKYKVEKDPKITEIIECNSYRFARGARNMALYLHTLMVTEDFETPQNHEVRETCTKLVDYFANKIAVLGFRVSISFEDDYVATYIQKNTFITIFLELCAAALRLSFDKKCSIRIYKQDYQIFIEYTINAPDEELVKQTFNMDTEFPKIIANHHNWKISDLRFHDGLAAFTFAVPERLSGDSFIRSPIFGDFMPRDTMYDISDGVFSYLFFE